MSKYLSMHRECNENTVAESRQLYNIFLSWIKIGLGLQNKKKVSKNIVKSVFSKMKITK